MPSFQIITVVLPRLQVKIELNTYEVAHENEIQDSLCLVVTAMIG